MRISEVNKIARNKGLKDTWKYSKRELIRLIQQKEGNFSCFATVKDGNCNQVGCCWRVDCLI